MTPTDSALLERHRVSMNCIVIPNFLARKIQASPRFIQLSILATIERVVTAKFTIQLQRSN